MKTPTEEKLEVALALLHDFYLAERGTYDTLRQATRALLYPGESEAQDRAALDPYQKRGCAHEAAL